MRFLVATLALALFATASADDTYYKKRGKRDVDESEKIAHRTHCGEPPLPPTEGPELRRAKREEPVAPAAAATPEAPKFNPALQDIDEEDPNIKDMRKEVATGAPTKASKGTKGPKPSKGTKPPKASKNTKNPLIQKKNSKKPHKYQVKERPFIWVLVKKYINPKKYFNPKFKRPKGFKGPKTTRDPNATRKPKPTKATKVSKAPKATKGPKTTGKQDKPVLIDDSKIVTKDSTPAVLEKKDSTTSKP